MLLALSFRTKQALTPMATLHLGNYVLEIDLVKIREFDFEYSVGLTCAGILVLEPWLNWPAGDLRKGHLYLDATSAFDEAFRPLLHEEWPVQWQDGEDGSWCTVLAYPSAFLYALEMKEPFGHNEAFWAELGRAANDRDKDLMDRGAGPKRFRLERNSDHPYLRLDVAFGSSGMQLRRERSVVPDGYGELRFSAYVKYDLFERFLDALKAEREALVLG